MGLGATGGHHPERRTAQPAGSCNKRPRPPARDPAANARAGTGPPRMQGPGEYPLAGGCKGGGGLPCRGVRGQRPRRSRASPGLSSGRMVSTGHLADLTTFSATSRRGASMPARPWVPMTTGPCPSFSDRRGLLGRLAGGDHADDRNAQKFSWMKVLQVFSAPVTISPTKFSMEGGERGSPRIG